MYQQAIAQEKVQFKKHRGYKTEQLDAIIVRLNNTRLVATICWYALQKRQNLLNMQRCNITTKEKIT